MLLHKPRPSPVFGEVLALLFRHSPPRALPGRIDRPLCVNALRAADVSKGSAAGLREDDLDAVDLPVDRAARYSTSVGSGPWPSAAAGERRRPSELKFIASILEQAVIDEPPFRLRWALASHVAMRRGEHIGAPRFAGRLRRKVRLGCTDLKGRHGRTAQPFSCSVWAQASTREAGCEPGEDFRDLRVERMQTLTPLDARLRDEPGKTPTT